jgi:hypothetical protein
MDEIEMAEALAFALNEPECWKATANWGDIEFTNEDGEKFRLTVEKIEG